MNQYIFIENDVHLVYDIQRLEADKFTEPFKYNGKCEVHYEHRSRRYRHWDVLENPDIMSYEEVIDKYPEYFI